MGGPGSGNFNGRKPRPRMWDEDIAAVYLERMRSGESCLSISRDWEMPTTDTIWHWTRGRLRAPVSFEDEYRTARLVQADMFAGQVIELADNMDERTRQACEDAINDLPEDATDAEKRRTIFYAKRRSTDATKEMISARKWTAGRMHPRNWGDRVALEHQTDPENPPKLNFSNMTDEQLARIAKLEEELGGGSSTGIKD